jgi:outer membrane protein OmpA-like peptidoglycan-associated protein
MALPFIGAYALNTPVMVSKIAKSATASLKTAGFDGVKLTMDGREAVLAGQVDSKQAIANAAKAVLGTRGVRLVQTASLTVAPPVILDKPTVKPQAGNNAKPQITGTWPEGAAKTLAVKVADKEYLLGRDNELISDGKGNWSLKPATPIKDGTYDVGVSVTDGKKAAAADASTGELVVDTTAPAAPSIDTKLVTRNSRPAIVGKWDNKQAKTLSVMLAETEYQLGKSENLTEDGKGGWSLNPASALKDGKYDVTVKTADSFGNTSTTTARGAVTVDTTAPQNGMVSVVQGNNPSPKISGKWDNAAGNTLKVVVGGQSYLLGKDKALTSSDNGNWSLVPTKPLENGRHSVTVTVADALGNERSMTAPGAVVVDSVAPMAPAVSSTINAATKPVIAGTWAEKAGNTLRVVVDGKVFALGRDKQLKSDGKGNWTLNLSQPLADGQHAILAESSDPFGNLARTEKPAVVVVDTTKPEPATIKPLVSSTRTPTLTGTWPNQDDNGLQVNVENRSYVLGSDNQLTSDDKGNWVLKVTKPLPDGTYGAQVVVTDRAGNKSQTNFAGALLIDSVKPALPTVNHLTTASPNPKITGTWPHTDAENLQVRVDGHDYNLAADRQLTSDGKGNWALALDKPLSDGRYRVVATATDKAGNASTVSAADAVLIDTTKPASPTIVGIMGNNAKPMISGTWPEENGNKLQVVFNGRSFAAGTDKELTTDGNGNWKLSSPKALSDGVYSVQAIVTDSTGNKSDVADAKAVVIDTTPPPSPTVTTTLTRKHTPMITGSLNAKDTASLTVSVANQSFSSKRAGEIAVSGEHWSVQPKQPIGDGTYDVVVTATDKYGNSSVDLSKNELVIDGTSPPTPIVRPVFGTNRRPRVSGSWAEDGQNTLAVTFNGASYSLGKNSPLTSDGKGNWKLALDKDLVPGSYDVKVKVADRMGNQSNDVSTGEIWVKEVKKPEPVTPKPVMPAKAKEPAPVNQNCQVDFEKTLGGRKIQFATNKAAIKPQSRGLIDELAKIAKACPTAKIVISGHTDSRGSAVYNQSLSEARASSVLEALVSRGIKKSRLRAIGYGETRPIADNKTKQGLAKNRRIEFKVEQ